MATSTRAEVTGIACMHACIGLVNFFCCTGEAALQLLVETCRAVLADEDLCAVEERKKVMASVASYILEQCFAGDCGEFAMWLHSTISGVVTSAQSSSGSINRERLWVQFHQVRSTSSFQ